MFKSILIVFLIVIISAVDGFAQSSGVPRVIGYQGALLEPNNRPKPDGFYSFSFALCNEENCANGSVLLETMTLLVKNGAFTATLRIPAEVDFSTGWWLRIEVDTVGRVPLKVLLPNIRLTASAYTFFADSAKMAFKADTAKRADTAVKSHTSFFAYNGVPVGSVLSFAGPNVPEGWLTCDGSLVDTSTYPALFSAIGYTWGGSTSTFSLPDLRGLFLRGVDAGRGADPDTSSRVDGLGTMVGGRVGSYQQDALQEHKHDDQGHTHGVSHNAAWTTGERVDNDDNNEAIVNGNENSAASISIETGRSELTGVRDLGSTIRPSIESRPKNAAVNFIIKAFPSTKLDY